MPKHDTMYEQTTKSVRQRDKETTCLGEDLAGNKLPRWELQAGIGHVSVRQLLQQDSAVHAALEAHEAARLARVHHVALSCRQTCYRDTTSPSSSRHVRETHACNDNGKERN